MIRECGEGKGGGGRGRGKQHKGDKQGCLQGVQVYSSKYKTAKTIPSYIRVTSPPEIEPTWQGNGCTVL